MASVDRQIDIWMNYIYGLFVQQALIFWNWITSLWDEGCEYGIKTLRAIEHAHKKDMYVFLDRNSMPIVLKEDLINDEYSNKLVFNEDTTTFFLHNRLTHTTNESFDCVDISFRENNTELNLTGFFMNLRWKREAAPSLVECISLYSLLNKTPFSQSKIANASLIVLDSSATEHRIPLNSDIARRRFVEWA